MSEFLDQVSVYFGELPLWPFILFSALAFVAFGIDIINRKRRKDAINNFRYTIEEEFSGMYPEPVDWPENVNEFLCARLPEMQENFAVLRIFIPQNQLAAYNKDWNKYRDFCLQITDEKSAEAVQTSGNEANSKEIFHSLISKLLQYVKEP